MIYSFDGNVSKLARNLISNDVDTSPAPIGIGIDVTVGGRVVSIV